MAEEQISMDQFEKEQKRREIEEKFRNKIDSAKKAVVDNKELIVVATPVVVLLIKGAVSIAKKLITKSNLKKEQHLKENFCYDRSLGHYWELKRKLSNSEWAMIEARKRNGETLAQILNDLNVLK